nr:NUDIX domain-containing protein [uncultured Sphingomonas sp.]
MTDDAAIPAATLIAWRDTPRGQEPQILVVQRSSKMAFAAGAVVFPGGRVDQGDHEIADLLNRSDQAARVTAIRETLEESAVAVGIMGVRNSAHGLALQSDLLAGTPFRDLMSDHGLSLDLDALTPFARWMPAFKQPRKFDTIFYLAKAPDGDWAPNPQPGECVAAEWDSPGVLLQRIASGDASAIFPTKRNLERLAQFASLGDAEADARRHSLDTIIPWVEDFDGEKHVTIPADRGYPVVREPLSTAFRA